MEVLLIDMGALAMFLAYMAIVYWHGVRGGLDFSDTGISGFLSGHFRREDHAKTET